MGTAPLLSTRDLRVHRGPLLVVDGVSLQAAWGQCLGLVGLNGAGKSSLLACLAGLLPSSTGTVTVDGADITGRLPWERCQAGLTLVPSGRHLFGALTVTENLLIGGHLCGDRRARRDALNQIFETFPVLADKRHQKARELSGGQQQMLAIGRGLMAAPKILLLDEPSEGLAPIVVEQVFGAIADLKRTGSTTILLAEQNAGIVDIGMDPGAAISQLRSTANGALAISTPVPGVKGATASFDKEFAAYQARFHASPNVTAWAGYSSVYFIAAALEQAGSTDATKLTAALHRVTLTQGHGDVYSYPKTLSFTEPGTLGVAPAIVAQIQDGKAVPVWPAAYAAAAITPYAP